MLADSHCHLDHLDLKKYQGNLTLAINAARSRGVKYILCPGITFADSSKILEITNDDYLFAALGLHPGEQNFPCPKLNELVEQGNHKKVVALGETGLDFHYLSSPMEKERQKNLFKLHIEASQILHKPLIVHTRNAEEETLRLLDQVDHRQKKSIKVVIHCFTGSMGMAKAVLELGCYLSFTGIVTFRKAESLREIVKIVPPNKILVETDSPYLAPGPVRGEPNEPLHLPYIVNYMAEFLGISYDSFAKQTTENFLTFCNL